MITENDRLDWSRVTEEKCHHQQLWGRTSLLPPVSSFLPILTLSLLKPFPDTSSFFSFFVHLWVSCYLSLPLFFFILSVNLLPFLLKKSQLLYSCYALVCVWVSSILLYFSFSGQTALKCIISTHSLDTLFFDIIIRFSDTSWESLISSPAR